MKQNGRDSSTPDRIARPWEGGGLGPGDGYGSRSLRDRAEEAVDLLQRRKWWVVGTALIIFHLVLFFTLSQNPLYSASSLVLVEEQTSNQETRLQVGARDLFARSGRSLQNELVILRSSRSLRRVVAERLMQQQTVPRTGEPISLLTTSEGEALSTRQVALMLERSVQFTPAARETDVIRITAYSSKPAEAAFIADMYLTEYLALTRESSRAQLSASRDFLQQQVEQRRAELQKIEARIKEYKRDERAVALDREGQNLVERIATVEASRDEAQVELQTRRASLSSLREELQSIRPEELSRRVASGVEKELEATQSRIAELELSKKQVLLRGNPDELSVADSAQVAQINRRIQELRRETQRLSDDYVDEVLAAGSMGADEGVERVKELRRTIAEERIAITGFEARIEVLSGRLQEYEADLASIPEQSMQLAQLERGRAYAEERYQSVVDQLQETRIQEETELGYADTVTEAALPLEPIRPRTERNLVLGLIFGLLFGVGLAVGRDKLDSRMYKPEELKEASGQRLLGTIPNIGPLIREQLDGVSTISVDDKQLASSFVAEVRPQSAAAEAFRHVRTNIQFSTSDVLLETLVVTSPGAGDGKTLTASNLAIVMAQAGRRTLLIDGDLRRPRLHDLFDLDRAPGLTEVLASDADASGSNIQKTPIENLQVLSAGASVDRPAERLSSAQLRTLLRSLKERFDFIVIDTPPVLAATDATYLSTQCDGTMVVARAGETTRPELQHALEALGDVGAPVIGMVLNGFDVSMAYGYTLRYRHYSRYGPYGDYQDPDSHSRAPARAVVARARDTARDTIDRFGRVARASWASAWDALSILGGAAQQGGARAYHTTSSFGQVLWARGAAVWVGGQLLREVVASVVRRAYSVVRRAYKAVQSAYRKSQPARDAVWSSAKAFGRLLHAKSVRLARRLRSRLL